MGPFDGVAGVPMLSLLNFVLLGCVGVSVSFLNLALVFERRHSMLILVTYFFIKQLVDGVLWYAAGVADVATPLTGLNGVWAHLTAVTSLFVVLYTFRGDYVQVGLCAVMSDLVASTLITFSQTLCNLWAGRPHDAGFLVPLSPWTFVCIALTLTGARLLRVPISWILRYLSRVALRHRLLWSGAVLAFVTFFISKVSDVARADVLGNHFSFNTPFMLAVLLVLCLLLLQRRRDVDRREQALATCVALTRAYDRMVGEQLAALERDRAVLEGHDLVLRSLVDRADSPELERRAAGLERSYRRLRSGNFCAQPALDAVLTSCAACLRERGAEPTFTVAGVPAHMTIPATTVLTLLNLALEAAERTPTPAGSRVELRIRSVGAQLLFHLDVPARWGAIGARRFLVPYARDRALVVRERRHGDRTLVLVIAEAQGS